MPLLTLKNICIAYGDNQLLDHAALTVERGQRIGLLGRNGEGKSTLLNIIAERQVPDEGEIKFEPGVSVATLEQAPSLVGDHTIYEVVATGLGEIGAWLTRYHQLTMSTDIKPDRQMMLLGEAQQQLDAHDGWRLQQRVEKVLTRLGLDADQPVAELSGGWQRRVSLARALVSDPQILLLDEPTNHLDIDSILWLENQVLQYDGAVLFVTHDRSFLQRVANQIVDLDRGKLAAWPGSYDDYLRRKEAFLAQQARQQAEFDRRLAEEEKWIRQGIKARRTRNEGRVRALEKMRMERARRRDQKGRVRMQMDRADNSGKLVLEANDIHFSYGDQPIISGFSTRILRGDRIGLLGPNGSGKTTLLKVLLGQLRPDSGTIKQGTNLEVSMFDQLRSQIDLDATVVDAIGEGRDHITVNGKTRHVISWLSDFLFTPARARSPVRSLSGGERARVLLARLFSKPTNLLVMDEPTNDLDIETLELLEELLLDFTGTLLLVSHDRHFMDNVVTSTLVMEGNGVVGEYVGGYSDWQRQRDAPRPPDPKTDKSTKTTASPAPPPGKPQKPPKLGYRQQQELDKLTARIEQLEARQATLTEAISNPGFYEQPGETVDATMQELDAISADLDKCYSRWGELES